MLSQQEISDRLEIQDLCYRYAELVDRKEFDALRDEVFSVDAHIDYSVFGGSVGDVDTTIEFLKGALTDALFPAHQHLNGNCRVDISGATATGRVMCFNPQEIRLSESTTQVFMLGLWYKDRYIRTQRGWRIRERIQEKSWAFNLPEFMRL